MPISGPFYPVSLSRMNFSCKITPSVFFWVTGGNFDMPQWTNSSRNFSKKHYWVTTDRTPTKEKNEIRWNWCVARCSQTFWYIETFIVKRLNLKGISSPSISRKTGAFPHLWQNACHYMTLRLSSRVNHLPLCISPICKFMLKYYL